MASTLAECRAIVAPELRLPSGIVVLLRRPDNAFFMGLGELPRPLVARPPLDDAGIPSVETPEAVQAREAAEREWVRAQRRQEMLYTERMIAEAVLAPPMSDARDEQGRAVYNPEYIHVTELPMEDIAFLQEQLLRQGRMTQGDATRIEAFRPDREREPGAAIGGDVSLPAPSDTRLDPGRPLPGPARERVDSLAWPNPTTSAAATG